MESTTKRIYEPGRFVEVEINFPGVLCASGEANGGINSMLVDSEIDGNTDFI